MMLAHSDLSSHLAAPVTPTQRQLQAAHLARRQRLWFGRQVPAPVVLDTIDSKIVPLLAEGLGPTGIAAKLGLLRETVKKRLTRHRLYEVMRARAAAAPPAVVDVPGTGLRPKARRIVIEVAAGHGLTEKAILGGSRSPRLCLARDEAVWRVSRELGWSLTRIGQMFGNRHHTTILQALGRHEVRLMAAGQGGLAAELPETARGVVADVAARHGVAAEVLPSRSRHEGMFLARAELCWRLHRELGWTLERVGQVLGGRDRATVLKAVRRHERLLGAAS